MRRKILPALNRLLKVWKIVRRNFAFLIFAIESAIAKAKQSPSHARMQRPSAAISLS
jgi:hypothetical protein